MAEISAARAEVTPVLIYDALVAEMGDPLAPFKMPAQGRRRKRQPKPSEEAKSIDPVT